MTPTPTPTPSPNDPLGLAWSADFPKREYIAVNGLLAPRQPQFADVYAEYAGGWNGIGLRFQTVVEADARFRDSLRRAGNSPPPPERYTQERDLYLFFVSALSALESFAYSAHAVASMVDAANFPMRTASHKRSVTLKTTRDRFFAHFPGEPITPALAALTATHEFGELELIRNVLAHRAAPPRKFYRGGDRDLEADWGSFSFPLDDRVTATRRAWLASVLGLLLGTAEAFAVARL